MSKRWTKKEDDKLVKYRTSGYTWKFISSLFPNRSYKSLPQRWHLLKNKKSEKPSVDRDYNYVAGQFVALSNKVHALVVRVDELEKAVGALGATTPKKEDKKRNYGLF